MEGCVDQSISNLCRVYSPAGSISRLGRAHPIGADGAAAARNSHDRALGRVQSDWPAGARRRQLCGPGDRPSWRRRSSHRRRGGWRGPVCEAARVERTHGRPDRFCRAAHLSAALSRLFLWQCAATAADSAGSASRDTGEAHSRRSAGTPRSSGRCHGQRENPTNIVGRTRGPTGDTSGEARRAASRGL
jgi:hypothetical protein